MTNIRWSEGVAEQIAITVEKQSPGFRAKLRSMLPETLDDNALNDLTVTLLLERGDLHQCEDCDAIHSSVECPHCAGTCGCAGGHGH
jgi:hypothetical protein